VLGIEGNEIQGESLRNLSEARRNIRVVSYPDCIIGENGMHIELNF
jgi:hypothetical protein